MNEQIFRQKSLDRVKSPEDLNDYVRVSNPGVWLILTAVIVLLVGICIWGIFGRLETAVCTEAIAANGTITCIVPDTQIGDDAFLRISDLEYPISGISYDAQAGRLICVVTANADIPDGAYSAEIVLESINPLSFVIN